jgi:putative oxidoreductase
MKNVYNFTAALLGFVFIVFGLNFFLKFIAIPQPPEGSPAAMFMGGMFLGGFLAFVKVLEILGGLLVVFPRTRNSGLLVFSLPTTFTLNFGSLFRMPSTIQKNTI